MITQNTVSKLPGNVLTYKLIGNLIVCAIFVVVAVFLISVGNINGTSTIGGVTSPAALNLVIPGIVLIVVGLLFPLYSILWYATFSFMVGDQSVTINSGVLFRQSKTIDFNKIQNVNNTRGPLQMIFGLTEVNVWTASQDQFGSSIKITSSIGPFGRTQTALQPKPEGRLFLLRQDADDLKNSIAQKGTVQDVRVI